MNKQSRMYHLWSQLAAVSAGVRFFSRLNPPQLGALDDVRKPQPFSAITRVLPLAALIILGPLAGLLLILSHIAVPALAVAAVVVALNVLITGALHEDGLADVADGFGGGHTVQRKLEIMRDSRIGAFGASALVSSLLIRAACLAALIDVEPTLAAAAFLITGLQARSGALACWAWLPAARRDGNSAGFDGPSKGDVAVGLLVAVVLSTMIGGLILSLIAFVSIVVATALTMHLAKRQIGGHTGDVIGASEQVNECTVLLALAAAGSALI